MKNISLISLMLLIFFSVEAKTIVLLADKNSHSIYIKDASVLNYSPGDTLLVENSATSIYLANVHGTVQDTVVISSAAGAIIGGATNRNLEMGNCSYFKLVDMHIEGDPDIIGCKIQYSTNFTLQNVNVYSASVGFSIKTDPNEQTQYPHSVIRDIAILDCSSENTHNEGFYLGQTSDLYRGFKTPPIIGLRVRNVTVTNAGWDGFQVTNAQNCDVQGVRVTNAGTLNSQAQRSGITIQEATTGRFSNLYVDGAQGSGLTIFSRGACYFDNITLKDVGKMGGSNAIFVDNRPDRGYGLPPQQLFMSNVKVIGGAPNAKEVMWVVNGSVNGAVAAIPGQIKDFSYDSTQWRPVRDGAANSYVSDIVVGPVDHGNTSTTQPDTSFDYAFIASMGRREPKPGYEYYQSTADSSNTTVPGTTNNCSCTVTHDTMGRQVPKPMTDNLTSIPGEPSQIEIIAGVGEVTIKWAGPDIDGNLPIKGYKIFRGTRSTSLNLIHLSPNDSFSYVDNNRPTGTAYYYAVRAINDAGEGNLSQPIQVTVK